MKASTKTETQSNTVTLGVNAIVDFQVCELFYDYRYRQKLKETLRSRYLLTDRFESTMKKVASFFFYKKQAGTVPSYNALLNRWEKLWFPKDITAYDLALEQHEEGRGGLVSYSNNAASILEKFHDLFADDPRVPVLIDEEFLVPIAKEIRLQGSFDLVLRDKHRRFTVIKWNSRRMESDSVLNMAAQRIAFEHRNSSSVPVEYQLYGLSRSGKFHTVDSPTEEDVAALKYWAARIRAKDEDFVPRRGWTAYCKGCPFDKPCAEFSDWPTIKEEI